MLSERIAEAKAEMSQSFTELAHQAHTLEALGKALSRRHACWPSRWGWGGVMLLLLYVIFMHSFHGDQHDAHQKTEAALATQLETHEQRLTRLETPPKPVVVQKKRWWQ